MTLLVASILGLCLGPVLFALLHRSERPQLALDGFVLIAVLGLVMLHVLPQAVAVAGGWALVAGAIGVLLPLAAERVKALSHQTSHGVVLAVALLGLTLHASLDGVGLGGSDGLGLAVVLHRIPVGLGVWWLVRPQFGRRWATFVLAVLCVATIGGFALQTTLVAPGDIVWIQVVQALVAGSLLHVVLHQSVGFHDHGAGNSGWRIPGAIGALFGGALVALMPDGHDHALGGRIVDVLLISAPYIVPAFGIALLVLRTRAMRALDVVAPWTLAVVVVGAMLAHLHTEPTALNSTAAAILASLLVLSLAHQGPRDFVLRVLPLDLIAGGHDHDHAHIHEHAAEVG